MKDLNLKMDEFDVLLDEVLVEAANVEPALDLRERLMLRVADEDVAGRPAALQLFGKELREEGILRSLWMGLQERFFPAKLPELVLESQPLAVTDRMAVRSGYGARVWAVGLHGLAILLIGIMVRAQVHFVTHVKTLETVELVAPPKLEAIGGGGGQKGLSAVTKGTPPKFSERQVIVPKAPPMIEPKIRMEPTIVVEKDVKMVSTVPQIGVANSPLLGMSMGNGSGTGLGSGNGAGIGPGLGGNIGGGLRQVGGGVSAPVPIFEPQPEFSEEARKTKTGGTVLVDLWVDVDGKPSHVHVLQGIGMGLDEKAMEAVKQYRFKPAMENGKQVVVEMNIVVTFDIL